MPKPTPPPKTPAAPPRPPPRWWPWAVSAADLLSLAGLFTFMLVKSWLRWSDPLIDFPKNLYVAWRISEGDLLYEKVTNWYGPLAHLVEAAGFRIFGVGMDTIVGMNLVLAVIAVLLVRGIFRALGNRLTGWLGAAVFIQAFIFARFNEIANYNFITPYASQATYSFLGLLLVLWALLRHLSSAKNIWLAVAGLGLGVAFLDKPEALLAAAGTLAIYFLAQTIRRARQPAPGGGWRRAWGWLWRAAAWLAAGFLAVWLPVFIYFWSRAGLAFAFRATDYTPLFLLQGATGRTVAASPMLLGFMGLDHPVANFFIQLGAGAVLLAFCGLMIFASRQATRARPFGARWWIWAVLLLAVTGAGAGLAHFANGWLTLGRALAFPVFLAAFLAVIWSLRAAWRGAATFPRALGLAVVGTAASLMLARMILNANISHYGFFMMPLAMLYWIHLIAGEAARSTPAAPRPNRLLPVALALLVFAAMAEFMRVELNVYSAQTMPVGSGRDRLYTFPLEKLPSGFIFDSMLEMYRQVTPHARTLVAFPEGIAINYHLRVPTTLAELEFHPVALGYVGPGHVLAEIQAHPPDAVFIFLRDYYEFTDKYFGQSTASGRDILQWVLQNYTLQAKTGISYETYSQHTIDLYSLQSPPRQN